MRYYDKNILCLTYDEFVPHFMTKSNYDLSKWRGNFVVYGRGGNGSEVLIDFETLPERYKTAVIAKYGDPYQYIVTQPLKDWVALNWNDKAFDFYDKYQLKNGSRLPENYRDKYTKAVTYLDAINYYTENKLALKRDFNIKMAAFWAILAEVFRVENVDLPGNDRNLQKKLRQYKEQGLKFIIEEHRFGNCNSKKVKDQLAEDVLMKLIENGNKVYDEIIANAYNLWASQNGRDQITTSAVGYRRRNNYHEVVYAREGKAAAYNKYNKQIKQHRPSSPLMLVNSDDNVLDLYFTEITYRNGRKHTNNYYRPVMYVVIDAYNDYVLGYAVGEAVTIELIKAAYRNAMQHVFEITGGYHLWHQIKTDKWAIDPNLKGELATFFSNQSHFFTADVPQGKYIERVFGTPLHSILKVFPNYSGHNITARGKNARVNPDTLQKNAKNHPDKAFNGKLIEMAINSMRHTIGEEGKTRQEEWLEAFRSSEFCAKRLIDTQRKIEIFGVKHPESARLLPSGLNFQLNKNKYSFEIPACYFPEYVNRKVELMYDPDDMGQVLITDNKGLRFVASKYITQPSALADQAEGDGSRLKELLQEKHRITDKLVDFVESRTLRIEREAIDAASLLQAGVLNKAVNHQAQRTLSGDNTYSEDDNVIYVKPVPDAPFDLLDAM